MGSSFLSPPAKRMMPEPYPNPIPSFSSSSSFSSTSANGQSSNKRSKHPVPSMPVPAGHVSFRLLCHDSRIGGIIGKSGSIIKQLQQQTGAKIRIEEAPPGCPDRVVTIVAPNAVVSRGSREGGELLSDVSRGQEALVRVFERVLEVAAESGGVGLANMVSCRMLAEVCHVGSVIGKGGKVVEKIRRDCGVKIRVLTDNLPACASSSEEVIEIEGDVLAVKKALIAVSERLQECQLVDKTRLATSGSIPVEATVSYVPVPEMHVNILAQHNSVIPTMPCTSISSYQKSSSTSYPSGSHHSLLETDGVSTLETKTLQQEVVFRILCSNDRVGGVIGKGGSIIKALQNETGASISIGATMPDCDDRLITITASENPESRYSAAQKTVVLVFSRSVEAAIERGLDMGSYSGYPVAAQLVVSTNQVGCLMGKGGSIISEIRKVTGAAIRILGKDQGPKCVPENDQVVQISGDLLSVKDAIYQCTGRLRDNLFSGTINTPDTRHTSSISNETSPYARMNDLLSDPLRDTLHDPLRGTLRDPLRDALRDPLRDSYRDPLKDTYRDPLRDTLRDPLGDTLREQLNPASMSVHSSVGVPQNVSRHAIAMQSTDHHGLSHTFDLPPPRLWASQAMAGTNPRVIPDVSRGLAFKGNLELGSGSKAAIVTNTTVEIIVPESVIGSVYGENGNNLARLRQISGAKVIVHEPRLGSTDRIVVISGTPDETQAAQSLLQAFILTG